VGAGLAFPSRLNTQASFSPVPPAAPGTVPTPAVSRGAASYVFDTSFDLFATLGYRFSNFFRLEGEFNYSSFNLSRIEVAGLLTPAQGSLQTYSGLVNFIADIDLPGLRNVVVPYVGGGIGYTSVAAANLTAPGFTTINETIGSFAYQVKAGLAFRVDRQATIDLGYRFLSTSDLNFPDNQGNRIGTSPFSTNAVDLSFRYNF
jgi:opacity protein-like surface antigen